ncbi:hypothetical protein BDR26DRAFT_920760 [Obelidium mucronatum]|nr:hypothetical protein BDR26DRAFT_920760 [Obelidium mucronatum]
MDPNTRILLYTPVESLKYPEAHHVFEDLVSFVCSQVGSSQMSALVLDCQNVHYLDATGLEMLFAIKEFLADHTGFNVPIQFYNTKPQLLPHLTKVNSYDPFSPVPQSPMLTPPLLSYSPSTYSGHSPVLESLPSVETNASRARPSRSASLNKGGQLSYPTANQGPPPPLPYNSEFVSPPPSLSVHRTRSNASNFTAPINSSSSYTGPGSAAISVSSFNTLASNGSRASTSSSEHSGKYSPLTGNETKPKGKSFFGRFKTSKTKRDSSDSDASDSDDSDSDVDVNPLKGQSADHTSPGFKSIYAKEIRRFKRREAKAAAAAAAGGKVRA